MHGNRSWRGVPAPFCGPRRIRVNAAPQQRERRARKQIPKEAPRYREITIPSLNSTPEITRGCARNDLGTLGILFTLEQSSTREHATCLWAHLSEVFVSNKSNLPRVTRHRFWSFVRAVILLRTTNDYSRPRLCTLRILFLSLPCVDTRMFLWCCFRDVLFGAWFHCILSDEYTRHARKLITVCCFN